MGHVEHEVENISLGSGWWRVWRPTPPPVRGAATEDYCAAKDGGKDKW